MNRGGFSLYSKSCGQSLSNEDRISELPEALLLQILSLLPTKKVVAMSVLSKRWRSLWKMLPRLKFDDWMFPDNVNRCLLSHQASFLQSLHLVIDYDFVSHMHTGILMGIAFGRHIRELVLYVNGFQESFTFPLSLCNCESLETLTLGHNVLIDVPSPVFLKSLRTLHLDGVEYTDDESVVNLLSGCISLENLVVHRVIQADVTTFTIAVPSLKRLTLTTEFDDDEDSVYVINAPSLKYLKILGDKAYLIENSPELVEVSLTDRQVTVDGYPIASYVENLLRSLTSVKRMSLKISSYLEIKFPTGSIFYQLVSLELYTNKAEWWNLLVLMLDSSPKLQVLKLNGKLSGENNHLASMNWDQPKNIPGCLLFNLETFIWKGCKRIGEDEKEVAKYILRNTNRLKRATFTREIYEENNSQDMFENLEMVEELESVVRASKSCKLVFESTLWSLSNYDV
ncbi:Leucine-rich repeat [Arabidopsis suecica]|uniref:Protein with RNI-like/FBD-like domain n=3 Tax=Arabidopsis TaxID=3701 RepID=A0A1I9LSS0_ARATH|nr:Protein with RNI-like/FBD-like domain [Arabidopsis thaliana]ANM65628.1 Protein with RNI-like/FBD-like domain [Arabidopsis thaliana]KAG7632713.1 Leucine-rich repeat [Arabidopsis suecica]|eukprot:NP_001327583.1 Protein with RNI-like/FBD-like domain [Arabidopsis thaliana]